MTWKNWKNHAEFRKVPKDNDKEKKKDGRNSGKSKDERSNQREKVKDL